MRKCILFFLLLGSFIVADAYNPATQLATQRVFYADTITLSAPFIIQKEGIHYVVGDHWMNFKDPRKSIESEGAFLILTGYFNEGREFWPDYDMTWWGINMSPSELNTIIPQTLNPEYTFDRKVKGCKIYRYKDRKIKFAVFLVQVNYFNSLLNPMYELTEPIKIVSRRLKSTYPYMEYVRVLVPIEILDN